MNHRFLIFAIVSAWVCCVSAADSTTTFADIRKCFDATHDKCVNDAKCKDELTSSLSPLKVDAAIVLKCYEEFRANKRLVHAKCFADAGVTDSTPCFAPPHPKSHHVAVEVDRTDCSYDWPRKPGAKTCPLAIGSFPTLRKYKKCVKECATGGKAKCVTGCTGVPDAKAKAGLRVCYKHTVRPDSPFNDSRDKLSACLTKAGLTANVDIEANIPHI